MKAKAFIIFFPFIFLWPLCLWATTVSEVEVTCPVDGTKFEALVIMSYNTFGGVDRDFCGSHLISIWTCPNCYYSGYEEDFQKGVEIAEEVKNKILKAPGLKPLIEMPKDTDQLNIPGWVKCDLMATVYKWRGKGPEEIAWAHLYASWSVRESAAIFPDAKSGNPYREKGLSDFQDKIWKSITQAEQHRSANRADLDLEIAKDLIDAITKGQYVQREKSYATFLIGFLLRDRGENAEALDWLARVEEDPNLQEYLKKIATRMKKSIPIERDFQKKAIDYFLRAFEKGQIKKKEEGNLLYLLGELHRRTGDYKQAIDFYQKSLQNKNLPEGLRQWAEEQLNLVQKKVGKAAKATS